MEKIKDKRFFYIGIGIVAVIVVCLAVVAGLVLFQAPISIQDIETTKVSSQIIRVSWSDQYDNQVQEYEVKRRNVDASDDAWEVVAVVTSDKSVDGELLYIEDVLEQSSPQQYIYRVDMKSSRILGGKIESGKEILASNVLICIDPGHFTGRNLVEGELSYGYAEGDFVFELAKELRTILKEKYGIDVYMTRNSEHINLQGYNDGVLDGWHISLRGKRAAYRDSDLFVSLHTNANIENAHGNPTCLQPISMNKPLILVNQVGCDDPMTIAVSNAVGVNLAKANYALGTASVEDFITVETGGVEAWVGKKNDALGTTGTVYYRLNKDGADYYGVLRGAGLVDKPGIIIEHGFHTVAEMRREAMEGDLKTIWANIDAYGIAYGFGFENKMEMADVLGE